MKEPAARLRDRRRRDEELPLVLPLDDQQAVEPDVVDEHAVGQVAARVGAAQFNPPVKVVPLGLDPRRNRLSRANRKLERPARRRRLRHAVLARRDRHRDLRLLRELDVAERAGCLRYVTASDDGRRLHHHGLVSLLVRRHRIG